MQYDPPDEPKVNYILLFRLFRSHPSVRHLAPGMLQEYIHRVGRTARGEGGKGQALLFLLPEELQFLTYLKVCHVPKCEAYIPISEFKQLFWFFFLAGSEGACERI